MIVPVGALRLVRVAESETEVPAVMDEDVVGNLTPERTLAALEGLTRR